MKDRLPVPSMVCATLWLLWALTNRGWIGNVALFRTWAGGSWLSTAGELLVFCGLAASSCWLALRAFGGLRKACLAAAVSLMPVLAGVSAAIWLPSKAATVFHFWQADLQHVVDTPAASANTERNWKYGRVTRNESKGLIVTFDYGLGVAGLLFNSQNEPAAEFGLLFCDPLHRDGGFIRQLAPHWFLCYRLL